MCIRFNTFTNYYLNYRNKFRVLSKLSQFLLLIFNFLIFLCFKYRYPFSWKIKPLMHLKNYKVWKIVHLGFFNHWLQEGILNLYKTRSILVAFKSLSNWLKANPDNLIQITKEKKLINLWFLLTFYLIEINLILFLFKLHHLLQNVNHNTLRRNSERKRQFTTLEIPGR